MKKIFLFLMAGLLCLNLISALEISAEYSTDVVVRYVENSIDLTLEITNASQGTYNLYTLADVSIRPSETFVVTESPVEKKFTITPTDNLDVEGRYAFTYTLNHRGVEKVNEKFVINLMNLEDVLEISSDSIVPTSGQVSFYVQNKESVSLKNLSAKFSSILFEVEKTFDLGPNEKLEIFVDADKGKLEKTKAGVYVIESVFQTEKGGRRIDGNLYLGEKKGITSTEDKSGFLIQTEIITKVNVGNVIESVQIKLNRNILSRLFTSFSIEPAIVERKGLVIEYTWIKEKLNPTEAYIVKAKTNYVLPFLIIVVAVLALFGFKRFSETKLEVKKSVSHVKTKNDEFALRVTLSLKARKGVENVTLIDKVPAIVKIYRKFGMVKPDKIDAESRRIHWRVGDLNAGEERIFTYIVYSKVGVVGKFSLPEALAVFEKDEKIHEVDSNKVFFMSDQIKGD
ncbi:MAG: hypothetical protein ABIF18_04375 [archaeon]